MSDDMQFVRDSLEGNAVGAQETFFALAQARIADKIDTLRQSVATNFLTTPEADNDEDSNPES